MDMILHCRRTKSKPLCDLFVRKALIDQTKDLLLTRRESGIDCGGGIFSSFLTKITEEQSRRLRRTDRVT